MGNEGSINQTGVVGKGTGYKLDEGGLVPRVIKENPVYEKGGKWYFWDETWSNTYGPFDSEEITRKKLENYNKLLS